jgi:hypothetical protein
MLSNQSAYQAFLDDQKKKKQEQAKGQVRFREASTASRIQYTKPNYTGNSKNANYKWETQALKDVKMPKHSSRTYNSKFDYLTKQMGLTPGQADDFRTYMDFGEDQSKPTYEKKIFDTDKNGNNLKTSHAEGSSLNTKSSIIDGILNGMTSRAVQGVKDSNKANAKKEQQAQQKPVKKDNSSFLGKAEHVLLKGMDLINRPGNAVRTGVSEQLNGNNFLQGLKEGITGQQHTSGTELNKQLGFDPINNKSQRDVVGTALNLASLASPVKAYPFLSNNAKSAIANNLPGLSTEINTDPLNALGGIGEAGKALSLPRQLSKVLEGTNSVRATDEAIKAGAAEAARGVSSPLVRQAADAVPPTSSKVDDFFSSLNFSQSGQGPTARGLVDKVDNPARYAKENVSNQADTILNRVDAINNKPQGYYEQRILEVQKAMQSNHGLTADQQKSLEEAQKAIEQYKVYEDAHVQKELTPFTEAAQKQADAQAQHQNIVKAAKDELARIKGTYGKIKATAGEGQDYQIPNQFRAGVNNMAHDDIHQFATQEGFSSVDEAVQYLKHLDETSKLKLKDVMPQDSHVLSADDWAHLEHAARKNFAGTPEGQTLDKFIADLVHAGQSNNKNFDELYAANKGPNDPQNFDELVKLAQMQSNNEPFIPASNEPAGPLKINDWQNKGNNNADTAINALLQNKNVNNSQDVSKVIDQLTSPGKLTNDELNGLLNGDVQTGNTLEGKVGSILKTLPDEKTKISFINEVANAKSTDEFNRVVDKYSPKSEPNVTNEVTSTTKPETSSDVSPLGITAGQLKANDISWVTDPQSLTDKVKSGKVTAETTARKAKTEIISDLQPVKDVERAIAEMDDSNILKTIGKNDVSAEDSLFKGLRGVRRSISEAMKSAKDDFGPILKTLRKNKISKRDFDEYISAVHFNDVLTNNHDLAVRAGEVSQRLQELEHLGQGTNDKTVLKQLADEEKALLKEKSDLEPYVLPASATPERVAQVLDRWKDTPAMQQAQKDFMKAQNKDLQLLVDSGVYSQATAEAMQKAHPNYIYMGRAKEDPSLVGAGGNSSKPNKFIIKRSKGSDENLKYSPLESAVRNRLLTYSNARRNVAMQKIEKLAQVKGAEDYFKELNPHTASKSQMKNSIKFFVDGAEKRYEVPTSLKDAFDNIDAKNAQDLVSNALKSVAQITRKGATYFNTDFIFSSVFRDANGLITSRTNMHPGELVLGYMDSFMGKGLERISGGKFKSYKHLYEQMGGHQTGFVSLDPQSTKQFMKDMDKGTLGKGIKIIDPRNWPEVITSIGGKIEHAPKLGEFRSAKNKGLSNADAMHEATDVIDYTDMGSTIRNWNDKIPFLNPAIRGNTRYFQAAKENFPKWMGKNLLYITTPTVGIYMMRFSPTTSDEQRSKLRNMSEYQKNMFWHIPVPNSETILSIPKMHTAAQLFGNPVERMLDNVFDDNPKTISRILKDTGADSLNTLVPPSAMAGVSQIKNAIANYDPLMDMPIEDLSMQHNPNKAQHYNSFTSEVAKGLGNLTNQSPAKIDYILKGLTGGTGRDILDITDNTLAQTGLKKRPQKVDTTLDILNPVRRYQYKDTSGLETSNDLYNQQAADTFNGNKSSDAVRLYKDMKELNKQVKAVREDDKMSSSEKKQAISDLRKQQRSIGDEAIKLGILKNR